MRMAEKLSTLLYVFQQKSNEGVEVGRSMKSLEQYCMSRVIESAFNCKYNQHHGLVLYLNT